jgi:hypothetical protein
MPSLLAKSFCVLVCRKAVVEENSLVRVAEHIHDYVAATGRVDKVEGELGVVNTQSQCPGPPSHQLVSSTCTTALFCG